MVCKVCYFYANVANQIPTFTTIDVPVATLSTQDNTILLLQLKSSFKRKTNWNK